VFSQELFGVLGILEIGLARIRTEWAGRQIDRLNAAQLLNRRASNSVFPDVFDDVTKHRSLNASCFLFGADQSRGLCPARPPVRFVLGQCMVIDHRCRDASRIFFQMVYDSFLDRWPLTDATALAAIANEPCLDRMVALRDQEIPQDFIYNDEGDGQADA
jgi:hypothetical protein